MLAYQHFLDTGITAAENIVDHRFTGGSSVSTRTIPQRLLMPFRRSTFQRYSKIEYSFDIVTFPPPIPEVSSLYPAVPPSSSIARVPPRHQRPIHRTFFCHLCLDSCSMTRFKILFLYQHIMRESRRKLFYKRIKRKYCNLFEINHFFHFINHK